MTTDQPARTPEERARRLLGGAFRRADGAVWFPGLDGDGFDVFVSGLVQELAAHAREVEALRAEVKQLRSEPDMVAEVERDLAALRARIEAAAREDDASVSAYREVTRDYDGEFGSTEILHLLSVLDATRAANAGLRADIEHATVLLGNLRAGYRFTESDEASIDAWLSDHGDEEPTT